MKLLEVVQEGDAGSVAALLAEDPELVNELFDGRTLLSWACQLGFYEVAETLLSSGANPKLKDRGQSVCTGTPLHEAVAATKPEIVRLLLTRGGDPNIRDGQGRSPLSLLVVQEVYVGRTEETKAMAGDLLRSSALLDTVPVVCAYGDESLLQKLCDAGADIEDQIEPVRLTGLHVASALSNLPCLRVFCSQASDVNPMDWEHKTPLDVTTDPKARDYLVEHGGKLGMELEVFPEPRPLIIDLLMKKSRPEH